MEKTEQCFCKSIYNGETDKVENCTCGKCQNVIDKKVTKEPECRFGHICTSSCGNDYDCPCQADHYCEMTEDCEGSTDPDDDHCESCMERTRSNLVDANK